VEVSAPNYAVKRLLFSLLPISVMLWGAAGLVGGAVFRSAIWIAGFCSRLLTLGWVRFETVS
jgi:hypothetical protein